MNQYAKAITALVVSLLTTWVASIGVDLDASAADAIGVLVSAAVTSVLVWAVPNTRPDTKG